MPFDKSEKPKTKKTDLQVLRALLSMPDGKLKNNDKKAFQAMYDNLASGRQVRLSERQRLWIVELFEEHKLDKEQPPQKKIEIKDKSLRVCKLDEMAKPLKPPGKA